MTKKAHSHERHKGQNNRGWADCLSADVQRAIDLVEGDIVYLEPDGGELRIRSGASSLRRIRDRLRAYRPDTGNLSDELIADRRAENGSE